MNSTPQQSALGGAKPGGPPQQGRPGDSKNPMGAKMPPGRTWLWLLAALAANYLMVRLLFPNPQGAITIPYTFFKAEVANGNVASIYNEGQSITGRFKTAATYPPPAEKKPAAKGKSVAEAEKTSPPPSGLPAVGARGGIPSTPESMTSSKFATTLPTF